MIYLAKTINYNHIWRSITLKYNIRTTLKYRNDMKQTAVEWLIFQLENNLDKTRAELKYYIDTAKSMEKEQSHAEYMRGWKDGLTKQQEQ